MPDCDSLQLLSVNCKTIEVDHNWGQVSGQSKEDKSKTKKSKINLPLDGKNNKEKEYFIVDLEKEINMATNAKITKVLYVTQ